MEYDRGQISPNSPINPLTVAASSVSGGLVSGDTYYYTYTYLTVFGQTLAAPTIGFINSSTSNSLTNISVSSSNLVVGRIIYRTLQGGNEYHYLATINDNITTTYVDSAADANISGNYLLLTSNTASPVNGFEGIIRAKDTVAYPVANGLSVSNVGTQAIAPIIPATCNIYSGVSAGSAVALPSVRIIGELYIIANQSEAALLIYPQYNGAINALALNTAYSLNFGTTVRFVAINYGIWITL